LESMNKQLGSIQSQIDGAIAGIALSAIAVVGGTFLCAVGGVTDFITAGTTTPLVVAGVLIVAAGVGGEVASGITLATLNSTKAKLLSEETMLRSEVKLATGISQAFSSLKNLVTGAVTAAQSMVNAWNILGDDITQLSSNLKNGITSADKVRELFLAAANKEVKTVQSDIQTIKQQMSGVQIIIAPSTETVGQAIINATQGGSTFGLPVTRMMTFAQAINPTFSSPVTRMMTDTLTGPLSQAQVNISAAVQQLNSISGLPSEGDIMRQDTVKLSLNLNSQLSVTKSGINNYIQSSKNLLNQMLGDIAAKKIDELNSLIAQFKASTSKFQPTITVVVEKATTTGSSVNTNVANTYTIITKYDTQLSSLQSQLESNQREANAAKKKYLYLLLLGLLGLPALAAALVVYETGMNHVNALKHQVNAAQNQISSLNLWRTAIQQEQKTFKGISAMINKIDNAMNIISTNVENLKIDPGNLMVIQLQVHTLLVELSTLASDAS